MRGSPLTAEQTIELIQLLAGFANDPVRFVETMFPWGEGELAKHGGPNDWQRERLELIRDGLSVDQVLRSAVASGHGIGKSALVSWIILWAISTREDTKGLVTANTESQLKSKTWAELSKWYNLFLGKYLFKLTATRLCSVDPARERTWFVDQIPWSEDNPEAFAGLHNQGKRTLVLFDEASAIADIIWETTEGAMMDADTEIIWAVFGNPTRNQGRFYECFHKFKKRWNVAQVDSRTVPISNHNQIKAWEEDYGEDSDFFRVRVLGQFPSAASIQLIPRDYIEGARRRAATSSYLDPLILGVDVARFGDNESVIVRRRGVDSRTWPVQRFRGLSTIELADKVINVIKSDAPDAVFIDEGGVGGGVIDFCRHLGHNVIGVNFGGKAGAYPDGVKVANKRAEMYILLRHWLRTGAIEDSEELQEQLIAIMYGYQKKTQAILLEDKTEMDVSPDWADALALTFALPVSASSRRHGGFFHTSDYDPMATRPDEYKGWMPQEAA